MGCGLLHNAITWVLCSRTIVGERQVSNRMTDIANVPRQNRTPSLHFRGFTVRTDEPEDVGNQEEKVSYLRMILLVVYLVRSSAQLMLGINLDLQG